MTKFSNKLKNPCFWPILGPFSQFWEQKKFPRKSGSVMHKFTWDSSTMSKFRKNYSKKTPGEMEGRTDRQTEGQTEPISQDPSGYHRGSNKGNLTFPRHTVNVIELNCKVIKKWQPPISTSTSSPIFRFLPPFLAKKLCTPPPQVTQFLEGPTLTPSFNRGGGQRSNYVGAVEKTLFPIKKNLSVERRKQLK